MTGCCPSAWPAESSLSVRGELLKPWANSANFCLRVIRNPLFPNQNKVSWNFPQRAQHWDGKIGAGIPGQSTLSPVNVHLGCPPAPAGAGPLPSNRYPICSLWYAGNRVAVTMATCVMSEIQSNCHCFILLIQESWNIKRGRKDCLSCFPNWGR